MKELVIAMLALCFLRTQTILHVINEYFLEESN